MREVFLVTPSLGLACGWHEPSLLQMRTILNNTADNAVIARTADAAPKFGGLKPKARHIVVLDVLQPQS